MDSQKSALDILNLAIERETQSFAYYTEKAESVDDTNLKKLFYIFAQDEQRHAAKLQFELLKLGKTVPVDELIPMMDVLEFTIDVPPDFKEMYLEILKEAIIKEDASFKMYLSLLKYIDDPPSIEILEDIIEEEIRHKILLEIKYNQIK